jgi:hypothetical protein
MSYMMHCQLINHENDESILKQWFEEYNLIYPRYTPQWAQQSKDLL